MGIFQRISDIVSANFNDMVEKYEDPEKMLRQAVREMEDAIRSAKPDVVKAMASDKTIAKELAANEAQCDLWAKRAETAVGAGDDELARKALTRKREYEKIVAALKDQHEAATEASQTLRHQLEAMQSKQKEAERRLGTLVARKKAAEVRTKMAESQAALGTNLDRDAFDKFDRMTKKVEMAEAEAEAMSELARSGRDIDQPEDLSSEDLDIEAELAALKMKRDRD